jgi:hypothetical protein
LKELISGIVTHVSGFVKLIKALLFRELHREARCLNWQRRTLHNDSSGDCMSNKDDPAICNGFGARISEGNLR